MQRHFAGAAVSVNLESSSIRSRSLVNALNTGRCSQRKESENAVPVQRWTKRQPENILIFPMFRRGTCKSANFPWGAFVGLAHLGIESPHAAVTSRQSDFAHGKPGFIDQLLGKMQPAGLLDG